MATQTVTVTQTTTEKFQTSQVLTIGSGHFIHDSYTAFVAPLLPLIIEKLSLSLTSAGFLQAFLQFPALLNPFIGYLADRASLRYFVILAPGVTASLMSLLGLAPNYFTLVIILLTAGVSVACFHAPAPAMIGRVSGNQVGKGMSLFMASGELGRTIGPMVVVWAVSVWTLEGFYRIMVVGWVASAILYWRLRQIPARTDQPQNLRLLLPILRRLFAPLLAIVIFRSFLLTALSVYLPTFMNLKGASLWMAGASLSIWELAGVVGALLGGTLSDQVGRQTMLLAGIISSSLIMFIFLNTSGWLLVPVLLALGFTALSTTPVMFAIVQEHLPQNRAIGSGLFIATAFLARPIAILGVGSLGDNFGLETAYFWGALISLLAVPFIFMLPKLNPDIST